jgi:TonB family protein
MAWLIVLAPDARAEDVLARAKDLYLSAAYDEALVLLEQLKSEPSPDATTEVEQYRVFCLLALERSDEARKAIGEIIAADPFYRPSETQTSPRIRAVFDNTRKTLLPEIVQRSYAEAKASFEKKDPKATAQFEHLLTLLDDPDLKGVPQMADLRTVVSGFRDLSQAMAAAPPPPKPVDTTSAPPAAAAAASVQAPVTAAPAARLPDGPIGFIPPVVIAQPLPLWIPPNTLDRRTGFKGLVEVTIDEKGSVTSATIQQSIHPLYDEKLLAMARTWKYKPALRNGVPTTALKVVEIQLQPAR